MIGIFPAHFWIRAGTKSGTIVHLEVSLGRGVVIAQKATHTRAAKKTMDNLDIFILWLRFEVENEVGVEDGK